MDSRKKDVQYGIGKWSPDGYGNHRALIHVSEKADAIRIHIPWRRRDRHPEEKDIHIYDAATQKRVLNVARIAINREYGDIAFQPDTVPGEYEVYYMIHSEPEDTADPEWLARNDMDNLPQAELVEIQTWHEFHNFYPMEVIATRAETEALKQKYPDSAYLLFPEDREHCIRMFEDLPQRWIQNGASNAFHGEAQPGEYYVFQIGFYAVRETIADLELDFADLSNGSETVPASGMESINLGGVDWLGRPFRKEFLVGKGMVRPLWIGIQIPGEASGTYTGTFTIKPVKADNYYLTATDFKVEIQVSGEVLEDAGDSDTWRLSRLRWLNSTMGTENTVLPPYTPLERNGGVIRLLQRKIEFGETGMPSSIKSNNHEILARPIEFVVKQDHQILSWENRKHRVVRENDAVIEQEWSATSGSLDVTNKSTTEFDGSISAIVTLRANEPVDIIDIALELPIRRELAKYMMGLGREGGYSVQDWEWKWNPDQGGNFIWLGDTEAGLLLKLEFTQDVWYYSCPRHVGLTMPDSWGNDGKGGCDLKSQRDEMLVRAYSGERHLEAGDEITYRFLILVTPFKPINSKHWQWRYAKKSGLHTLEPLDHQEENHCTIAHLHHGDLSLNPWINYPLDHMDAIKDYMERLKEHDFHGLDIYYTVRELSNHAPEIWALRSLGDEVYTTNEVALYNDKDGWSSKPGGGDTWLQEHLVTGYTPAWVHRFDDGQVCASIGTQGLSRWHNYYVQGMDLMMKKAGVDGLYIDGVGYDRQIMKRIARVMAANSTDYRVKMHSGNNYTYMDWKNNVLGGYCEHLPFITDLWIGEGFDYDKPADYWLVEISGIPFGLTSEMLEYGNGGNAWRGMLYGMYGRFHDSAPYLWKFWDSFGIEDAEMIGYWDAKCPVKTGRDDVLATVYRKKDKSLIAIASWSKEQVYCSLEIAWEALGLNPSKARLKAPALKNYQEESTFRPGQPIPVPQSGGWLLVVKEHNA